LNAYDLLTFLHSYLKTNTYVIQYHSCPSGLLHLRDMNQTHSLLADGTTVFSQRCHHYYFFVDDSDDTWKERKEVGVIFFGDSQIEDYFQTWIHRFHGF